jgi:hypothetical protein
MLSCNYIVLNKNEHLSDEPIQAVLGDKWSYTRLYALKPRVETPRILSNLHEAVDRKLRFRRSIVIFSVLFYRLPFCSFGGTFTIHCV